MFIKIQKNDVPLPIVMLSPGAHCLYTAFFKHEQKHFPEYDQDARVIRRYELGQFLCQDVGLSQHPPTPFQALKIEDVHTSPSTKGYTTLAPE